MLNQATPEADVDQHVETYDIVVVGAGIAGLNALYAATHYLPRTAKALLIDQKPRAGGMWNTAYDYVHLHQPHPMFTVGDLKWKWSRSKGYLAARDEVQAHLSASLHTISDRVHLDVYMEHTVIDSREVKTTAGYRAELRFHPNGSPDAERTVLAHRVIHAPGLNYKVAAPLQLSSKAVHSIIPQDLRPTLAAHSNAPVYVVGGGKTGMDTVLAALAQDPKRPVTLINGRGTTFFNRTKYLPTGLQRWTSGTLVSRFFHDLASTFDGDNEDAIIEHVRRRYSTDPAASDDVFLYGLQSEEEHARIQSGLSTTLCTYLDDVIDEPRGPQMILRNGEHQEVETGSIFVNCSGSFFRGEVAQPQPCQSPKGTITSLTARDGFHFLTSVCGFFVTHLLYRDLLRGKGFYTVDHEALFRQNRNAWVGASAAQAYMNQAIAVQNLPLRLLDKCGLDLDRWYPLPRRAIALFQMKSGLDRDVAHCRQVLDRVAARFGTAAKELT